MTHDPMAIAAEQLEQLERAWNNADGAAYGASPVPIAVKRQYEAA